MLFTPSPLNLICHLRDTCQHDLSGLLWWRGTQPDPAPCGLVVLNRLLSCLSLFWLISSLFSLLLTMHNFCRQCASLATAILIPLGLITCARWSHSDSILLAICSGSLRFGARCSRLWRFFCRDFQFAMENCWRFQLVIAARCVQCSVERSRKPAAIFSSTSYLSISSSSCFSSYSAPCSFWKGFIIFSMFFLHPSLPSASYHPNLQDPYRHWQENKKGKERAREI